MTNKLRMLNQSLPFRVFPELNLVLVKGTGVITLFEVHQHFLQVIKHPQFEMGMNAFYDFRLVERLIGDEEIIEKTAQSISDNRVVTKAARTAILLPGSDTTLHLMAHRYINMTQGSLMTFKVFDESELQDALHFVSLTSLPDDAFSKD